MADYQFTLTHRELKFLEQVFGHYMDNEQIDEVIEANNLWAKFMDQYLRQTGKGDLADKIKRDEEERRTKNREIANNK
jgi:hypothetical protein